MSGTSITVIADIHHKEGWWYATSQQLNGLLVTNQSLCALKQEIPDVIGVSLQVKYKKSVSVELTILPNAGEGHQAYVARVAA